MYTWHEGIYGNADAQEFLSILHEIYEVSESLDEFLSMAREHELNRYPECRFVLADLEGDLEGELDYPNDVYQMIEHELSSEGLSRWANPVQREQVLRGFKASLIQRLAQFNVDDCLGYEEIPDWIERKREAGVFESTD